MANLNEAFITYKQQNTRPINMPSHQETNNDYMNRLMKKIPVEDAGIPQNSICNNFSCLDTAFDRVKVSNIKYDKIIRGDRPIYGYICRLCNGCMGYHISIQNTDPHDFVKGEYRPLLPHEQGPFYNGGIPLIN